MKQIPRFFHHITKTERNVMILSERQETKKKSPSLKEYEYDAKGQKITETESGGIEKRYTYDISGRCPFLLDSMIQEQKYRKLLFEKHYLIIYKIKGDIEIVIDAKQNYSWLIP